MAAIPDWQLPDGVDRGLWDYLHSEDMVAGYDAAMSVSALPQVDVAFCEKHFQTPGRLVDLGCGTGRLCHHFAAKGFECVGLDLSEEMLKAARATGSKAHFQIANLTDLKGIPDDSFDYAACLFSTLGMIRGAEMQSKALREWWRILKPNGTLVVHAHNRLFVRELGLRGLWTREFTMPQAYGGAPLTLTHFSKSELVRTLTATGFQIIDVRCVSAHGILAMPWLFPSLRSYGFLVAARKKGSASISNS